MIAGVPVCFKALRKRLLGMGVWVVKHLERDCMYIFLSYKILGLVSMNCIGVVFSWYDDGFWKIIVGLLFADLHIFLRFAIPRFNIYAGTSRRSLASF